MDKYSIQDTRSLKSARRDSASVILAHLNAIQQLKSDGYSYKCIASCFDIKYTTFMEGLKRARILAKNNPSLDTSLTILHTSKIVEEDMNRTATTIGMDSPERTDDTNKVPKVDKGSDKDTEEHEEDWAAKLMRTATPSKYAKKFNLKLNHQ